jgi:hypothetical protein
MIAIGSIALKPRTADLCDATNVAGPSNPPSPGDDPGSTAAWTFEPFCAYMESVKKSGGCSILVGQIEPDSTKVCVNADRPEYRIAERVVTAAVKGPPNMLASRNRTDKKSL